MGRWLPFGASYPLRGVQFGLGAILQYSITPRGRIRGQPARRSLPEFQTTGRSREDDDKDEYEAPCEVIPSFDAKP